MTEIPVHPIAELFPMLPDDELQELAEDIKQRGLLHPIVLDAEGRLLDGRNRLAACSLADVAPAFSTYPGADPAGYALGSNIARRHLTKGQRAMVLTQARAVLPQNTMRALATEQGLSASRLAYASTVLEHAPDLASAVATGDRTLDEAYKVAQERKIAAKSEAEQLRRLAGDAPDLAEKVRAGEMTLTEARGAAQARAVERQRDIESARRAASLIVSSFQTHVATIVGGIEYGEANLVTGEMLAQIRKALDLLEARCAA